MRMTWTGLGMHQGYLPGWPASHGCIRLPAAMAKRFFEELPKGTPVEVIP
jgi:lipoprotein-anchoring transpeptidase ErfK/SrfK